MYIIFSSFILLSSNALALTVTINGPSEVCPLQTYTFTSTVKNWAGQTITPCSYSWHIMRNGVAIFSQLSGSSLTYTFDDNFGSLEIRLFVDNGIGCAATASHYKPVNIRIKSPNAISGPSVMGLGETKTFSTPLLQNTPQDCYFHHKYNWSLPSGWSITSTYPTHNTVSIKAPSSAPSGTYQIRVRTWYDDINWYSQYTTINVILGKPVSPVIQGPSQVCPGSTAYFTVNESTGITNFNWSWPSDWVYLGGQGTKWLDLRAPSSNFGGGGILVWVTNTCGTTGPSSKSVQQSYSGCGSYTYSVFPNPVETEFEVSIESEESDLNLDEIEYELQLYDQHEKLVRSLNSSVKDKSKIDTRDLKKGTYYLHITDKNGTQIKQVFINK